MNLPFRPAALHDHIHMACEQPGCIMRAME